MPETVEELLAAVPDDWVRDAAALGAAFSLQYEAWRGSDAVLNPKFSGSTDIGGGDADLIIDGCLWDIKTTTQGAKSIHIYQILGYALLDYADEFAIERVGLIFPRQDTQVSWRIGELIERLSGRDDLRLPELRERFREVCGELRDE